MLHSSGFHREGTKSLLNDGIKTYTYDSANRLKAVIGQQLAVSYGYNGLGERLQETLNGQTTSFTMDLNPSTSLRAGSGLTQALSDGRNTYYVYPVDSQGRIEKYKTDPRYDEYLYYTDYAQTLRYIYIDSLVIAWNETRKK